MAGDEACADLWHHDAHRYQVPVPAYEKVAQKLQGEIMCEKNSHTEGNVEIKREEK